MTLFFILLGIIVIIMLLFTIPPIRNWICNIIGEETDVDCLDFLDDSNMKGYLLMWGEDGDEVHADLIAKEHYDRIVTAMNEKTDPEWKALANATEKAFKTTPVAQWFTQTYCHDPWPYNDIKILGTVSVSRT